MKKLFSIFLVGVFILVTFAFLPTLVDAQAVAVAIDDGGGGGGGGSSTTTTVPTPPPYDGSLILTSGLNKSVYNSGETVSFTVSVSREVSSSISSDIKIEARVSGTNTYTSVMDGALAGGVTLYSQAEYTAPSTVGGYNLEGKADIYSPEYYSACTTDLFFPYDQHCVNAYTQDDLDRLMDESYGSVIWNISNEGGVLLDSVTFEIPFTVVVSDPVTADITIVVDEVEHNGTTTVSSGKEVRVFWKCSSNATSSEAKALTNTSSYLIGSEIERDKDNSYSVILEKDTTFSLTCTKP